MQVIKKIIVAILIFEARLILKKYKPFVVAITGSVGKTSTKDAVYSVVKKRGGYVRKSDKSWNTDIGLPLTIIGVPNAWRSAQGWIANMLAGLSLILIRSEYPDTLILELGADHPGDISRAAKWIKPHIAVITRISATPVHVEFFDSPEQVFEEKATLATSIPEGGSVILFADDAKVMGIADRLSGKNVSVTSFGLAATATVKGSNATVMYEGQGNSRVPTGFSFKTDVAEQSAQIIVRGSIGDTYMYPLLAAAAVGVACKMDSTSIIQGMNEYNPPRGRMKLLAGIHGSTLIDDTYNSSPDAVETALKTLKSLECTGRRIAILGDMMELGKYSPEEHRRIGALVIGTASVLITVGPRSHLTADEAIRRGMSPNDVHVFDASRDAITFVTELIKEGDSVLIKGSQSSRMEHISKALLADPTNSAELLVRQEKEWLDKV